VKGSVVSAGSDIRLSSLLYGHIVRRCASGATKIGAACPPKTTPAVSLAATEEQPHGKPCNRIDPKSGVRRLGAMAVVGSIRK
jgi:hypothetical protein